MKMCVKSVKLMMVQISGLYDVRNPVKKGGVIHLLVGVLEDIEMSNLSLVQISGLYDVRNPVKKGGVLDLLVGVLEDIRLLGMNV